jgi:tRNA pseudouridine38-40 synthase
MRLALVVEYEGTRYHGFQYQLNAPSIQEEIEKAIGRLTGKRSRIMGAGRTDAGVHAKGQVAVFDTNATLPVEAFVRGLNFYLPEDIAVQNAYRASRDFDPRRMAVSRRYQYTIDCAAARSPLWRRTAYHYGQPLNIRRMRTAARIFVGEHDFARFAGRPDASGGSTVRKVLAVGLSRAGETVRFDLEANSFLPHQVRRMAGALVDIGRGRLMPAELRAMLEGGSAVAVAHSLPPHGLCLLEVKYAQFPPKVGELDGNAD